VSAAAPTFSIVVAMFNEEAVVRALHERVRAVMETLGEPFELVVVDDGSSDSTLEILRALANDDRWLRVLSFSRNFGHQAAVTAGLRAARGRAVIVMDGDLQDPPEVIPDLVERWREGYDVAYAVRRKRKEGWFKRQSYALFYRLLHAVAYVRVPVDSGDFALMDRRVVDVLNAMPERNPFVRGIRAWVGFRQIGVEYERAARTRGVSKYSFGRLVLLALDGLVSYSFAPLRVVANLGLFISTFAFIAMAYLVAARLVQGVPVPGWTSTVIIMLFLGGIQLLSIGVIGEYVGRIFDEVKQRPLFIVREEFGGAAAGALRLVEAGRAAAEGAPAARA
jgi:dolichol-phosphate mannosyltransferase